MKRFITPVAAALAVAFTALGSSSLALADVSVSRTGPTLPHDVITYQERMPNGALIGSGLTMFGFSYIPSMIVAASSARASDSALYMPVVGPWVDLAQRDRDCVGGPCRGDAGNQVLLAVNGVVQGIGVLQILGGFLFPTTRTVTRAASVQVLPTVGASQVGLTAVGAF
jgi:hypothetical protein